MGFLTNIFGAEANIWTVFFALIIVVVLIIGGVWALKLLFNASGSIVRGRQKRLALIDTMAIDNKHNLVLVRRDDVEHLLVISPSGDLVVETGIPAPSPQAAPAPRSQATAPPDKPARQKTSAERLGLARLLKRSPDPLDPVVPAPARPDTATPALAGGAAATAGLATPAAASGHAVTPPHETSPPVTPTSYAPSVEAPGQKNPVPDVDGPVARAVQDIGKQAENTPPPLRHTGLLKPVSELVSVSPPSENISLPTENETSPQQKDRDEVGQDDKTPPQDTDSDMNEAQQIDAKAMESIEEGAAPGDEGTGGRSNPEEGDERKKDG